MLWFVLAVCCAAGAVTCDDKWRSQPGPYPDRWWDAGSYLWGGVAVFVIVGSIANLL